jgi:hypothetical protein
VARAVGGSDVGASSTTQPDNPSVPSSRAHISPPQPPSASGGGRLASTLVLGRETRVSPAGGGVPLGRRWFWWWRIVLDGATPGGVAVMAWTLCCGVEWWPMAAKCRPRSRPARAMPELDCGW